MKQVPTFYIGCDPEVFLQDAAGAFVSAIGKIGGSKVAPRPLEEIGNGFAVQEDNVALEFNIPAAGSEDEFVESIEKVTNFLQQEVNGMGLAFSKVSAARFPQIELIHPAAMEFGCDPDYNAWTTKRNPRPKAEDNTLRSCGGHIHVGYPFMTQAQRIQFIKFMDLFAGVPSVLMDQGDERRKLYGGPGAFRPKTYGVEYRTLSNFWIFDRKLIKWAYQCVDKALAAWDKQHINVDDFGKNIQAAIKNNNKDLAHSLVDHFNLQLA
jgi:hypothetical protein